MYTVSCVRFISYIRIVESCASICIKNNRDGRNTGRTRSKLVSFAPQCVLRAEPHTAICLGKLSIYRTTALKNHYRTVDETDFDIKIYPVCISLFISHFRVNALIPKSNEILV